MLIAIIFDCIPEELRIKISLNFGDEEWKLNETMGIIKLGLEARERSSAISGNKQSIEFDTNDYYSTQSLHINTTGERTRGKRERGSERIVICNEKHLSSRCRNVRNINTRYDLVRRENRCYITIDHCILLLFSKNLSPGCL